MNDPRETSTSRRTTTSTQQSPSTPPFRARSSRWPGTDRSSNSGDVLESLAVGYLAMDADWRITHVNAEGRRALGAAGVDLVGQVLWELFPATVGTEYETHYRRAVETGEVIAFEAFYPEPLSAWFEIRATPERGGLALYFLDITARRVAQEARDLTARRLAALGGVALALTDAEDVGGLVTVVAERGLAAVGCDGGAVAVPDPDNPHLLLSYVTASYGAGARADYAHLDLDTALPVCEAARTGQRVLVADRDACHGYSPATQDVVQATGSHAFASLPLRAGGHLIGVLTAGWDQAQTFDAEQLDLLETLAAQCAQALQRLQARDGERAAVRSAREAAEAARVSTAQQGALVAIARALGEVDTEEGVLAVVAEQGTELLEASGAGLLLHQESAGERGLLRAMTIETSTADLRSRIQHLPASTPLPVVDAAVNGAPHFLPDRAAAAAAFPGSAELYAVVETQASASVPLLARGQLLGALSIAFRDARVWTQSDRDLVAAFAALTAQALERVTARIAEHAARAAEQVASAAVARFSETMQRSLLSAPAHPDHLQVAVRYAPAAAEAFVGGDWYDSFTSAAGVTSIVVGDVAGHDRDAAAVMAQMRNMLRGIGYTVSDPPAEVLATLDRAATGLGVGAMASVVLAAVEQSAAQRAAGLRTLRWSNAGHPPPLLVEPGGGVRFLEGAPDLLLGVDATTQRQDHQVVLALGSMVLLYTDGLVERRGAALDEGLTWLAGAVQDLTDQGPEGLCDGLLALVDGHCEDDVALLVLLAGR